MKTLRFNNIALLFLFLSVNAFSQTGIPFAADGSHWSQKAEFSYTTGPGTGPIYVRYCFQTQITGDTIINNMYLQKLSSSSYEKFDSVCLNFWRFIYYKANQVYIGNDLNNMNLIYDFNLAVGDSFTFNALVGTPYPAIYTLAVNSVDSINLGGILRKRIIFDTIPFYPQHQCPIQWVEGIGDYTYGWVLDYGFIVFANYVNWGCFGDGLICFTDNSTTTFGNCEYQSCALPVEETQNNYGSVYPNPSNDRLKIALNKNYIHLHMELFTLPGKKIFSKDIFDESHDIEINTSAFTNGFYLLSLKEGDSEKIFKVIIQH